MAEMVGCSILPEMGDIEILKFEPLSAKDVVEIMNRKNRIKND